MQMLHGYDSNGHTSYRHDDVFDNITQHNAVHASQYGVEHGKQRKYNAVEMCYITCRYVKRNVAFHHFPRHKYFHELTQANEAVGQKAKATNESKHHYHMVRPYPLAQVFRTSRPLVTLQSRRTVSG